MESSDDGSKQFRSVW